MKVRRVAVWSCLLVVMGLLSACAAFEDPSKKATQNAESTALWATVGVAQNQNETIVALIATADNASVLAQQATQVSVERDQLRATINAVANNPVNPGLSNIPFGSTPPALDGGVPAGPLPTNQAGSSTTTQNNGTGIYVTATTGSTLTTDFCAADSLTTFASDAPLIYFVTVARNIPSGVEFSIRVSSNGSVVNQDTAFWTSDDVYPETCIYYALDNANIPNWAAGTYTVELLANNQSVSQVTFQILGTAATTQDTSATEESS
ncbi:MAG: hypothetical protein HY862_08645 [Chloroflexi bacterium]|nr:hypothetical protein [Chloroflexota bacterium]